MPRAKKKQVSQPLPPEGMRDPLANAPAKVNQALFQIAREIDDQWPPDFEGPINNMGLPKRALGTLRDWLEKPAQADVRTLWWQGLEFIQSETPLPLRQAMLHHLIQDTLTYFGIRLVARENEPFVLKVSMPNGGPSDFSSLHVTCMATDPEADKRDYMALSRRVATLFNLMITYAYELRLREKPWSTP